MDILVMGCGIATILALWAFTISFIIGTAEHADDDS